MRNFLCWMWADAAYRVVRLVSPDKSLHRLYQQVVYQFLPVKRTWATVGPLWLYCQAVWLWHYCIDFPIRCLRGW